MIWRQIHNTRPQSGPITYSFPAELHSKLCHKHSPMKNGRGSDTLTSLERWLAELIWGIPPALSFNRKSNEFSSEVRKSLSFAEFVSQRNTALPSADCKQTLDVSGRSCKLNYSKNGWGVSETNWQESCSWWPFYTLHRGAVDMESLFLVVLLNVCFLTRTHWGHNGTNLYWFGSNEVNSSCRRITL